MKKTFFIAATSVLLAACGQQKVFSSNLIQVSEFSIVTTDKDTLYLKEGDEMSMHLKANWDNGAFRNYDSGINTSVIMVNEETFNTLSGKSIKDPVVVQRLSKLTDSY
jgi:hypothetical protein